MDDHGDRLVAHTERRTWMKRKHAIAGLLVVACTGLVAWGAVTATAAPKQQKLTKVTLQLKWVTQAQFAGYYAALAQGYYKAAGLDVKLKIGGPSITPETVVVGKQAEFGLDWLPNLFATREHGSNLVSVAQMFERSGMTELTWKSSGINTIAKMRGKKVGVWCCGNEPELFAALAKNGINHAKSSDVTIVNQPFNMDLLLEEPGRSCCGDDVQRARSGAGDEEPDDGQALPTLRPERLQDGEPASRDRHARGQSCSCEATG